MDILENKVSIKDNWCPYYFNKAVSIGTYTCNNYPSSLAIEVGNYKKEENLVKPLFISISKTITIK